MPSTLAQGLVNRLHQVLEAGPRFRGDADEAAGT